MWLILILNLYSTRGLTCFKVQLKVLLNEFEGALNTEELFDSVNGLLLGHVGFVIERVQGKPNKYKAQIKSKISCEDGIKKFVKIYCAQTNESLRCDKKKDPTENYKVRQYYRCQHNTKYLGTKRVSKVLAGKHQQMFKNTNCEFLRLCSITNALPMNSIAQLQMNEHINTQSTHYKPGDLRMRLNLSMRR